MAVTPGKNWPGQKGFPTPDNLPDDEVCRVFHVPNNDAWLGVLMAAVEQTLNEWQWFEWGSMSIPDTVAIWNDIILQAYDDATTLGCPAPLLAPYWDSATDVDAQADIPDQTWYGLLEVS